jgi:hypothetical protein
MPEITEDNLVEAQPRVRAEQILRYEQMFRVVQGRIQDDEDGTHPLDPRFLELGIRILKEEAGIYRLGKVLVAVEEEEDPTLQGIDRRATVEAKLQELEDKVRATTNATRDATFAEGSGPDEAAV